MPSPSASAHALAERYRLALRTMGLGGQVDDFERTMNSAAETAAGEAVLMLAAGSNPDLCADHRGGVVFVENDGEAAGQGVQGGGGGGEFHAAKLARNRPRRQAPSMKM